MDHREQIDAAGTPGSVEARIVRYCRRCQAPLPDWDLTDPKCMDCGLQFNPADPATSRDRQALSRWIFWLPGFLLAVASGIVSYAVCLQSNNLGLAMFVAVPISVGAILGYATRGRFALLLALAGVAIPAVVMGLISLNAVGFFCGLTLSAIFVAPLLIGLGLGFALRWVLCRMNWSHRWYFPLLALVALPYAAQGLENLVPRNYELATVRTTRELPASPQEAWNGIVFYEEVQHAPPWLLRLALPRPVRSIGDKRRVGEAIHCFYNRGYLSKRITQVEEGRRLEFEVVEQHLHFEHDVTLRDGSFEVLPTDNGQASVVLTTRYQPRLSPRWLWEPMERHVVHALHGHVLEGMTRQAMQQRPPAGEGPYPAGPGAAPAGVQLAEGARAGDHPRE